MRRRLLIFLIPPLFVLGAKLAHDRWEHARGVKAVFGGLAREPYRRLAVRLSYPPADQYRPFSAPCDQESCREHYRHADLARLEKAGDVAGLVAAYVLSGEYDAALRLIDTRPELESDRAAVLAQHPRHLEEALAAADRARGPRALWNRAILLEGLGLPLAAARDFHAVERLKEPGWSEEAAQRALRLESEWRLREALHLRGETETAGVSAGRLPGEEIRRLYPERARRAFYAAVRDRDDRQNLRPLARILDEEGHTHCLVPLVDHPEVLRKLLALYRQDTPAAAEEYGRVAGQIADPWFETRAEWVRGHAASEAGDPAGAVAAFKRGLDRCASRWFPELCIELKIWLAHVHADQRQLQDARRWALEARRDSETWSTPSLQAEANARLAAIEELRERFSLARAYATETTLQHVNCSVSNTGLSILASIDVGQQRMHSARERLAAITACAGDKIRFNYLALETLAQFIRVSPAPASSERDMLAQGLEAFRDQPMSAAYRAGLERHRAVALLSQDRARARADLERLARPGEDPPFQEELGQLMRLRAATTLAMDAGEHGEMTSALATLERTAGVSERPCTVGLVDEGGRILQLARDRNGRVSGVVSPRTDVLQPPGCDEVGVIATAPVLGRSRLLPGHLAWAYLHGGKPAPAVPGMRRHLIVADPTPPEEMGLPRLAPLQPLPTLDGVEVVERLSGAEATPRRTLARALDADLLEWHVHGIVDPEVSDAAALVLSPDDGGGALLTARDIAAAQFTRAPGVILGACRAALSARYGHFQWSLPLAFLRAGAGWVMASPSPVEDQEAPTFFAGVWRRIAGGASPAVALRDERQHPRWRSSYHHWTDDVVVFE
jgi:hypothetical protein